VASVALRHDEFKRKGMPATPALHPKLRTGLDNQFRIDRPFHDDFNTMRGKFGNAI